MQIALTQQSRPLGVPAACGLALQQSQLTQDRDAVRVDILSLHEAVLERDHVEAVPADLLAGGLGDEIAATHLVRVGGLGGPLLNDQRVPDIESPGAEGDVGPRLEDLPDVPANRLALSALARGVVREYHVRSVHGHDRVQVVGVPGVVVGADGRLERGGLVAAAHAREYAPAGTTSALRVSSGSSRSCLPSRRRISLASER